MDGRLDNILLKLKSGNSITNDERDYIRSKISFYDDTEELEQAIRSFGLACSPTLDNIKIIEIFLSSKSDIVLSGAIKVLCANSYWGLVVSYIDTLKSFLKKEDAYELSETQIAVFSVLGEYLHKTSDPNMYEYIYSLFITELEEYKDNPDFFFKARLERMYHCLDTGIRGRIAEVEYRVGLLEFPKDINQNVIMDVVNIIKKKSYKKNVY